MLVYQRVSNGDFTRERPDKSVDLTNKCINWLVKKKPCEKHQSEVNIYHIYIYSLYNHI